MADPKKQDSIQNRETGDSDGADRSDGGGLRDSSSSSVGSGAPVGIMREIDEVGLTERLTNILVDEGDGDLLIQQNDREDRLLQWLQALDLQVMGACRADERLKPLLKLNVSGGAAEGRLLAHLNQHFEAAEVGMLARCLCIPLVSIRVGKIVKQGSLLCPTATRGNLNLALLPTSDLRISFIGDDGCVERLATLRSIGQRSAVAIEEISEDSSGRSFILKVPDSQAFYFWCSEKSKLLGIELLAKMMDLLQRTPSLADLTGICEARLSCFATHLRSYLIGSTMNNHRTSSATASLDTTPDHFEVGENSQISSSTTKFSRSRHTSSQAVRTNSTYQSSLSPRSSSFKDGLLKNSSLRTAAREKFRKRGESHLSAVENLPLFATITTDGSSSCDSGKGKAPEDTGSCPPSSFLESPGNSTLPPFLNSGSQAPPIGSSLFSPYYCLCPPRASSLQYTVTPPLQQMSSESLSLPPLSSFLPTSGSSGLLNPVAPLSLSIPSMDFPAFFPEPLVRLPFSAPSSQQIPTFTPLMCDPIVHVPVIDVCSSGQGYLVSAGSGISTSIPPLHTNIMRSLGPETDSVVDKGARETLRLLISSSSNQASSQLMDVLPAVLTSTDEKLGVLVTGSRGLYNGSQDVSVLANGIASMGLVTGSRGLYSGSQDVGALSNGIASLGLVPLSGLGERFLKQCNGREELDTQAGRSDGGSVASTSDDQGFMFSKFSNEGTDLS